MIGALLLKDYFILLMRSIARDVLLYTLLMDDADGLNHSRIWKVYYNSFIDNQSLELLHLQAKKLQSLAVSMQEWQASRYGSILRFCDRSTLAKVREVWRKLSTLDMTESERKNNDIAFMMRIGALNTLQSIAGSRPFEVFLQGYRATLPAPEESVTELLHFHRYYWENGTTDCELELAEAPIATYSNPMFTCLETISSLGHYTANPIIGFHLALAKVHLGGNSIPKDTPNPQGAKDLHEARLEFQTWSTAFRKRAEKNLTLRFFVGDALAFCQTLEYKRVSRDLTANLYRSGFSFEPLILDNEEYTGGGNAPLSFDIIDTSNLGDYVGAINVLAAASPLLEETASATLYTETQSKHADTYQKLISDAFCGDLPTVAVLFRLFPVEYYANASAVPTMDECTVSVSLDGSVTTMRQIFCRIVWKRPLSESERIHFDNFSLANLLHQVYREMFRGENRARFTSEDDKEAIKCHNMPFYHRGSFVALLRQVRSSTSVDWDTMLRTLLRLILNDSDIETSLSFWAELAAHVHILGIWSLSQLNEISNSTMELRPSGEFAKWKGIPHVLCITLSVPRSNIKGLKMLCNLGAVATPVYCVCRTSKGLHACFADLQLAFGKISISGSRNRSSFEVHIAEDESGWTGDSDLNLSFYTPAWLVWQDPDMTISFEIQPTFLTSRAWSRTSNEDMIVYKTTLRNQTNVYITAYPPGQSSCPNSPLCSSPDRSRLHNKDFSSTISARLDAKDTKIVAFIRHIDFLSKEDKTLLRSGAHINVKEDSPCAPVVTLDSFILNSRCHKITFPAPVDVARIDIQTRRKDSHIELKVPIAAYAEGNGGNGFMYPLVLRGHQPVLMNMPYLNLNHLPTIDLEDKSQLTWLDTHVNYQYSSRERLILDRSIRLGILVRDTRILFKEAPFFMFMDPAGLTNSKKVKVFGFYSGRENVPEFVVFVSSIRLDVGNRTVVLDAAVISNPDVILQRYLSIQDSLDKDKYRRMPVCDDDLILLKKALPAWAERCRDWKHRDSCEYKAKNAIPLTLEKHKTPLCSCGNGRLPRDFITEIPRWRMLSKHAVRVAISVCFPVQYVDPTFTTEQKKSQHFDFEFA